MRHIDHALKLIGADHVVLDLDYILDMAELEAFLAMNPEKFPKTIASSYQQVEPERFPEVTESLLRLG